MTNRAYKKAYLLMWYWSNYLQESFGKLDPSLVQTLCNEVTQFSNGTMVKLSDNRVGEIVFY